jgi:hypothetical protein
MANQTSSKNFFEGYSRSKDFLSTIAEKITSATTTEPWEIKSQGRIQNTAPDPFGSNRDSPYICLRHKMFDGRIYNILIVESWNKPTPSQEKVYGVLNISVFADDGCNVESNQYANYPSNAEYHPSIISVYYHQNQVNDDDGLPQFAWYWIWVDDETLIISPYGNVGAAGSATSTTGYFFFGRAKPIDETKFYDTVAYTYNGGYTELYEACIEDYMTPVLAPYNWTNAYTKKVHNDMIDGNSAYSNPDPILQKFIATTPKVMQATQNRYYSWSGHWDGHYVFTHLLGNNRMLFCQPGDSATNGLKRGDIVSIDSIGCDFLYQYMNEGSLISNVLIKRMESATNLVLTPESGKITLAWKNPNNLYGIKIVRKTDTYAQKHNDITGTVVYDSTTAGDIIPGAISSYEDTSTVPGTTYYYTVFAYSSNGIFSCPVSSAKASAIGL